MAIKSSRNPLSLEKTTKSKWRIKLCSLIRRALFGKNNMPERFVDSGTKQPIQTAGHSFEITPKSRSENRPDPISQAMLEDDLLLLGISKRIYDLLRTFDITTAFRLRGLWQSDVISCIRGLDDSDLLEIKRVLNSQVSSQTFTPEKCDMSAKTASVHEVVSLNNIGVPDEDIGMLGLSDRTYDCLYSTGITKVSEIRELVQADVLRQPSVDIDLLKDLERVLGPLPGAGIIEPSLLLRLQAGEVPLNRIGLQFVGLSTPAYKRLKRAGYNTIQQLADSTVLNLLDIPHVGNTLTREIKTKLNLYLEAILNTDNWDSQVIPTIIEECTPDLTIENEPDDRDWELLCELATHFCAIFNKESLLQDLELPGGIRRKLHEATEIEIVTLSDLEQAIKTFTGHDRVSNTSVSTNSRDLSLKQLVIWFQKLLNLESIDDEVHDIVRSLSNREQFIFINRFIPEKHVTLEAVGNQLGITRERVRQIEQKLKDKLAHKISQSPLFYSKSALIILMRMGDAATLNAWKQRLIDTGLLKHESTLNLLGVCPTKPS